MARWAARLWPLLAVAVLLATVAVLAQLGHVTLHSQPPKAHGNPGSGGSGGSLVPTLAPAVTVPTIAGARQIDSAARSTGVVLLWVLLAVAAAAVAGGLAYTIYLWRPLGRRRGRPAVGGDTVTAPRDHRGAVIAAVEESLVVLTAAGTDARAAVIDCWVRLEEIAASAGIERAPGDTPADFVARLLATAQVSRSALTELAGLYRAARYSPRDVDATMRDRAVATLGRLREELSWAHRQALATVGRGEQR